MALPVMAALEGLSLAAPIIGGLFKKNRKYGDIPSPEFFGPEFEALLARTRQSTQAGFADVDTMIRESLADSGLLRSGALPNALTQSSIAQGQQIAGQAADLTGREFAAKRSFDIDKFQALFGAQEEQKKRDFISDRDFQETLAESSAAFGDYLARKKKKKPEDYNSTVRNPDGTSVDVEYDKSDDVDVIRRILGIGR